jgi:hypothetical protein
VRAVGDRTAAEAVALDGPLEALTLTDRSDVYLVPLVEDVDLDGAADPARDAPELFEVPPRWGLVLLELARVRVGTVPKPIWTAS